MAAPERFADIAAALGENISGLSVREAGAKASAAIRKLNEDIGILASIAELGAKEADMERLARESVKEIPVRTNPRTVSYEEMVDIYKAAMGTLLAKAAMRQPRPGIDSVYVEAQHALAPPKKSLDIIDSRYRIRRTVRAVGVPSQRQRTVTLETLAKWGSMRRTTTIAALWLAVITARGVFWRGESTVCGQHKSRKPARQRKVR